MIIILTCHTEGCGNAGIGIMFPDPADLCICGVCNNEITDKAEFIPAPDVVE